MTDSDFLLIRPVETVHNVPSLTPAKEREERKRRQRSAEPPQEPGGKPASEAPEEQASDRTDERHRIDYRA